MRQKNKRILTAIMAALIAASMSGVSILADTLGGSDISSSDSSSESGSGSSGESGQTSGGESGGTPGGESGGTSGGESGETPGGESGETPGGESGAGDADKAPVIVSVAALEEAQAHITVAPGTAKEDIPFPAAVKATVRPEGETDGTEQDVPVKWNCDTYDANVEASYTFTATAEGYTLAEDVSLPEITVTVGQVATSLFTMEFEPITEPFSPVGSAEDVGGNSFLRSISGNWNGSFRGQLDSFQQGYYDAILASQKNGESSVDAAFPATAYANGAASPYNIDVTFAAKKTSDSKYVVEADKDGNYFPVYELTAESSAAFANLVASLQEESSDLQAVIDALIYDHPEIFWLKFDKNGGSGTTIRRTTEPFSRFSVAADGSSLGSNAETVTVKGFISQVTFNPVVDNFGGSKAALDSKIDSAKTTITNSLSGNSDGSYGKLKAIHDWICENVEYDLNNMKAPVNQTVWSAFNGNTVCAGYAKAFKLLCQEFGYSCVLVSGTSNVTGPDGINRSENHMWNYVQLDSKWYAVDTTWDDQGNKGIYYDFFLVGADTVDTYFSKQAFNQSHTASGRLSGDNAQIFGYPPLNSEKFDQSTSLAVAKVSTDNGANWTECADWDEVVTAVGSNANSIVQLLGNVEATAWPGAAIKLQIPNGSLFNISTAPTNAVTIEVIGSDGTAISNFEPGIKIINGITSTTNLSLTGGELVVENNAVFAVPTGYQVMVQPTSGDPKFYTAWPTDIPANSKVTLKNASGISVACPDVSFTVTSADSSKKEELTLTGGGAAGQTVTLENIKLTLTTENLLSTLNFDAGSELTVAGGTTYTLGGIIGTGIKLNVTTTADGTVIKSNSGITDVTFNYSGSGVETKVENNAFKIKTEQTTSMELTAGVNSAATYGTAVTVTASGLPRAAARLADGTNTVTFSYKKDGSANDMSSAGATELGKKQPDTEGKASYTIPAGTLDAGTYGIYASYDGTFGATDAFKAATLTVNKAKPTLELTSSRAQQIHGNSITLTGKLTYPVALKAEETKPDKITVTVGGGAGSPSPLELAYQSISGNEYTYSATFTGNEAKAYTFDATVPASTNFEAAAATQLTVEFVDKYEPVLTLEASKDTLTKGESLTLTATIANPNGVTETTPTGKITFNDGTADKEPVTISGGTAKYTLTPDVGVYSFTAKYVPDAASSSIYKDDVTSDSKTVTVQPKAPESSVVTVDYAKETISFDSTQYEVSSNKDDWTTGAIITTGSIANFTGRPIYVRVKVSGNIPPSAETTINLPARPATPTFAIDYINEKTTEPVASTVEYKTTGNYADGDGNALSLEPGQNVTFRVKATDNSFASAEQVLTVKVRPAKPAAPTASAITDTAITLKAASGCEFQKTGETAWQDSTTFTGLTPNTAYTFGARVKAVKGENGNFCSEPVTSASITTSKAALVISAQPTASGTYGQKLSEITLADGKVTYGNEDVDGAWAWTVTNPDSIYPQVNDTTVYEATFTPTDTTGKYDALKTSVKPVMAQKELTIDTAQTQVTPKPYDGTTAAKVDVFFIGLLDSDKTSYTYTVDAKFADANASTSAGKKVTGTVTLTGETAKNYKLASNALPDTLMGFITPVTYQISPPPEISVFKDTAANYSFDLSKLAFEGVPASQTAGTISYSLDPASNMSPISKELKIENGKLIVTTLGTSAENATGTVIITVSSTNFTPVDVTISYRAVSRFVPVEKAPVTVSGSITNGDKLSVLTLNNPGFQYDGADVPGTLAWQNADDTPGAGQQTVTWVFTPTDAGKYMEVKGTVTFNVAKQDGTKNPAYAVPSGLTVEYSPTGLLSSVSLPAGWEWVDGTIIPTVKRTSYPANYRSSNSNFDDVLNVEVPVEVTKATPVYTVPTGLSAITNFTPKLDGVKLPADPNGGQWIWADGTQSLKTGTNNYSAKYIPADQENYKIVTVDNVPVNAVSVTANIANDDISDGKLEIALPGTKTLTYADSTTDSIGQNYSFQWKSANTAVAEVDGAGVVTAKKAGMTTISLQVVSDGQTAPAASILVTVKNSEGNVPQPDTAVDIADITKDLGNADDAVVKEVAEAVKDLDPAEQKKLTPETVEKLDELLDAALTNVQAKVNGQKDSDVATETVVEAVNIKADGLILAAYDEVKDATTSTDVTLEVKQVKPTTVSDALMEFNIELKVGSTPVSNPIAPVTIKIPLPENVTSANLEKHVLHNGTEKLPLTFETIGGQEYGVFRTSSFSPFSFVKKTVAPTPSPTPGGGSSGGSGGGGSSGGSSGSSSSGGGSIFGFRSGELDFWNSVKNTLQKAKSGDVIKVNAKGYDRVPSSLLNAVFGKDATLQISWKGGDDIVIYGKSPIRPADKRIYYPLSMLADLYAQDAIDEIFATAEESLPETLSGTASPASAGGSYVSQKTAPATGGVWNLEAPASGELAAVTPKTEGFGTSGQLQTLEQNPGLLDQGEAALSQMTSPDAGQPQKSYGLLVFCLAAAAAIGIAAVIVVRRKHQE